MRLIIAGDFAPTDRTIPLFESGAIDVLFGDIPEIFQTADRVIVNLECALTTADTAIRKIGPNLKGPPVCAKVLRQIGVTDCSLSNNHVFDFGMKGLKDTIEHLEANSLSWTGVGENDTDSRRPLIIENNGKRVGIIAVCEHEYTYALPGRIGANPYDPYLTMEDIRMLRMKSDYVIVLYHGGSEHCRYPSPRLRRLCQAMAKNGADIVLCQHSHCIGVYEKYENSHLLYGQGNFHFVKDSPHDGWYSGFIVILDIDDACRISFLPVVINEERTGIRLARAKEKEKIIADFEARNQETDLWLARWESFCESQRERYISVIANAYTDEADEARNQFFAHYLDCEAHTDVWRTLCKTWNHTNEK